MNFKNFLKSCVKVRSFLGGRYSKSEDKLVLQLHILLTLAGREEFNCKYTDTNDSFIVGQGATLQKTKYCGLSEILKSSKYKHCILLAVNKSVDKRVLIYLTVKPQVQKSNYWIPLVRDMLHLQDIKR